MRLMMSAWVKSGHVQRPGRCPLYAKSGRAENIPVLPSVADRCNLVIICLDHRRWSDVMRGAAVVIFYLLGLGAIISFGIAGLMALQPPTIPTPSAPIAAAAHKERVAKPVKRTTQRDARSDQKRKTANATRKRIEEASTSSSGFDAYGFADEQRRFYQYPFRFFGR